VGRHRDPEQFHLLIFGKAPNLDELALGQGGAIPIQFIHSAVGQMALAVIDATITF
jgi:hypothetical protein